MTRYVLSSLKTGGVAMLFLLTSACSNNQRFNADDSARVKDSTTVMMKNIERDISAKGPIAWVDYFENSPGFFMASGGQIALKDYPSAIAFVKNTLVKVMPGIKLQWKNIRIDPFSHEFATVGSGFHEDITIANGTPMHFEGYFTATVHFNGHACKLRNLHWSILPPATVQQ